MFNLVTLFTNELKIKINMKLNFTVRFSNGSLTIIKYKHINNFDDDDNNT